MFVPRCPEVTTSGVENGIKHNLTDRINPKDFMSNFTIYPDINEIITALSDGINDIFSDRLVGIYLFGSLSYGDFDIERSDIDLEAVLATPTTTDELAQIKKLHDQVSTSHPLWSKRLECSYTPLEMLSEIMPPTTPRPYYGESTLYEAAPYGNEWIINQYLLYQHSVTVFGSPFKTLTQTINIVEVQKASIRDLFKEWEPKITDPEWLNNSHYQSYLVLNLCRILNTVMNAEVNSKKVSADWVKKTYPDWKDLIQTAENWHYGVEMNHADKTVDFIKFTIKTIKETNIFRQTRKG